ncbi:TetR family transcriptional regulator [Mycobacterium rhizamassiliense]|jgi:AcrR family transcriptional regulator|uniref:TetR family transcriptional regulator n=1 Tax=Mycobacterium rhizamassiliense TaxID=1841860 RepID=A0A2U3P243_9MYCO|nr:TetR/AcrR family transcriptional regulator [Mycobacterium rhizamassiliense]SPM37797.1 TetR family transcriptional regulator [Mycobacterium rhizamassiliense]
MGRKGWGGTPPADDAEARKRIVDAAVDRVQSRGPRHTTLSDVATDLGITRPTIYRYFASIEDLLAAAAEVALDGWTARIGDMSKDISDATDLLTEAVAFLIEQLPDEPLLAQLLETDRMRLVGRQMVMPAAVARSRTMLQNTQINWAALGFTGARFDDLVEFLLRMIQSMVIAPSDPPRTGAALRDYLRLWIGPVMGAATKSAPPRPVRKRR